MTLPTKTSTVHYVDRDYDIKFNDKDKTIRSMRKHEIMNTGGCGNQGGYKKILYLILVLILSIYAVYISTYYAKQSNVFLRILIAIFAFFTNISFIIFDKIVKLQ